MQPKRSDAPLRGRRVLIDSLGCRTNLAEAEALCCEFRRKGAEIVSEAPYDAAVVVTCSVTSVADRKSRQLIHRYRRECPGCCVVACGCWAQGAVEKNAAKMGVSLLVGNRYKAEIPGLVAVWLDSHPQGIATMRGRMSARWDPLELEQSPYFGRAFVKVQDGCDHHCTYCIVPARRGPSVSRPVADIIAEARRCAEKGQFEIILTGVHLGLFGRDSGETLAGLVRALGQVEGVKRLRFGSLEPFSIGDDLLEALAGSKIFCRHLHLPVQSGDDAVLARMKRGHTMDDYLKLVARLRAALGDDLHISTDVMCAFPGESEAAFANTLALLDEARIGRVHAFRFSPRPGTPAAVMSGQIDGDTAKDRMERLRLASAACLEREARRWTGRRVEVLFEGEMRGYPQGYTREYIEFRPENAGYYNQLRKITARSQNGGILSDVEV
ncbi:MAG: MiaB/RimO family radical SAM methylthiotransferase [Pyramidobacter sp.]|nr:MiaB/RimO family radical SAM methylthiotransferase [Pyramidobacter sp.]